MGNETAVLPEAATALAPRPVRLWSLWRREEASRKISAMHVARRRPDGTFSYGDRIYRLEECEPDHFDVRRTNDGEIIGHLRFLGTKGEMRAEGELRAGEEGALSAIRSLLEGARGILPLQ